MSPELKRPASNAATSGSLAGARTQRAVRLSWDFVLWLALFLSVSGLCVTFLDTMSYFVFGILDEEAGTWLLIGTVFIVPVAGAVVVLLLLICRWRRVGPSRRLVWIGLFLLFAVVITGTPIKWLSQSLRPLLSHALPREDAFLYGFRERVRLSIDVQAIRAWAQANAGMRIDTLKDPNGAGRFPECVRSLDPWFASALPDDSTAVFEGPISCLGFHDMWLLVVSQANNPVPAPKNNSLTIEPGVWVAWVREDE